MYAFILFGSNDQLMEHPLIMALMIVSTVLGVGALISIVIDYRKYVKKK
jgi:hypothetical protein